MPLKQAFFFIFLGLLFTGCSGIENKKLRPDANAVPSIYLTQNSEFKEENGVMFYKKALYSGYVITFFENGDTNAVSGYLNGKKENTARSYYPNKQLKELRVYHQNKKVGEHVGWYSNGTPRFKYNFGSDVYDGTVEDWFENSKRAALFNYKNGYEIGLQQAWYTDGKFRLNYEVVGDRKFGLTGVKNCESVLDTTLNKLIAKRGVQK